MTERINFGRKGIFGNLILVGPELEILNSNSGPSTKSQLAETDRKSWSFNQGSPDLKAAREVADYLGTVHHEFHFTVQVTNGLND